MTSLPRFERNLPGILEDLYVGPSPDYRDDLLATARRTRQRPAWSFPERWIPMDIANRLAFAPRYPVRLFAVALLVLALVAAGLVWYAGTHPTIKPALPFGPAGNGAIVYALGGDIYVGDPTGNSHRIVSGAEFDRNPLVSPDGTHVAFLRTTPDSTADSFDLIVANVDGSQARAINSFKVKDSDPAAWSPDSKSLLMMSDNEGLYRYNIDGTPPVLVATQVMARSFLPPDGRQLVYEDLAPGSRSLGLMNADGTDQHLIYTIPAAEIHDSCDYAMVSASPDGSRIAFNRQPPNGSPDQCRIFVMNTDGSGAHQLTTDTDVLFEGNLAWSPDGTKIAFNRWNNTIGSWQIEPIGVASLANGSTVSVGPTPVGDGAAFAWSPDGKTIISAPATVAQWPPSTTMPEAHPVIIDVATGASHQAAWTMSSSPSWQRVGQ